MPSITFIAADGASHVIKAQEDLSLMENAVAQGVETIEAVCGGNAYCGTCRVYPEAAWRSVLGEATEIELPMIEAAGDDTDGVRLSCQIRVTRQLDGLVVRTPPSQS
ncbi:2Fe-2S iron-sulfur cluster-binding protein [Novosphingobium sp. M1R2S20]|uniref:2Fe-2S iron-sulfur cluster-binding protein n=1 Tax=Novosphingobium rhizovicinum TaxID=3228928 RepID=A0ABV3RD41_9SPHN